MTDDAEATLFEAIRAITPRNFCDESLAGLHERAVLLAAIEAYNGNLAARLAGVSEALTHAEQQLAVYDKLIPDVARWQLMQAKAAVSDAYMAWTIGNDEEREEMAEVLWQAKAVLRELESKP